MWLADKQRIFTFSKENMWSVNNVNTIQSKTVTMKSHYYNTTNYEKYNINFYSYKHENIIIVHVNTSLFGQLDGCPICVIQLLLI